jgi:hypothetical protein
MYCKQCMYYVYCWRCLYIHDDLLWFLEMMYIYMYALLKLSRGRETLLHPKPVPRQRNCYFSAAAENLQARFVPRTGTKGPPPRAPPPHHVAGPLDPVHIYPLVPPGWSRFGNRNWCPKRTGPEASFFTSVFYIFCYYFMSSKKFSIWAPYC